MLTMKFVREIRVDRLDTIDDKVVAQVLYECPCCSAREAVTHVTSAYIIVPYAAIAPVCHSCAPRCRIGRRFQRAAGTTSQHFARWQLARQIRRMEDDR